MTEGRSTKRQRELLNFVDVFIQGHGYGPSYREIMRALGYKSVSTVAIHIDGLIQKGYLRKRDNSARSLEVITVQFEEGGVKKTPTTSQEKWLTSAVNERFVEYEQNKKPGTLDELYVLIGAMKILGLEEAHLSLKAKLESLKQ